MQSTLPIQLDTTDIRELPRTLTGKIFLAVGASAFVAVSAHVSLPLYFTPVPLTLQTFAVILVGLTLSPMLSFAAMVLYLAEGAAGLPVFSPHSIGLLGPTAGFLMSYPLAAPAAGAIVRASRFRGPQFSAAVLAGTVASIFFLGMGATWLAHMLHATPGAAWHMAVAPFLPGEVLKVIAAASAYASLRRWHRS